MWVISVRSIWNGEHERIKKEQRPAGDGVSCRPDLSGINRLLFDE
jgi:hypothetical protein